MVRVMVASGRSRMSSQPRERPVRVEVGRLEGVGGVLGVGFAGEADAGEAALEAVKMMRPVAVVPSVGLVSSGGPGIESGRW